MMQRYDVTPIEEGKAKSRSKRSNLQPVSDTDRFFQKINLQLESAPSHTVTALVCRVIPIKRIWTNFGLLRVPSSAKYLELKVPVLSLPALLGKSRNALIELHISGFAPFDEGFVLRDSDSYFPRRYKTRQMAHITQASL